MTDRALSRAARTIRTIALASCRGLGNVGDTNVHELEFESRFSGLAPSARAAFRAPLSNALFGDHFPQRFIDGLGVWERFRHVRSKEDEVGSLLILGEVLPAHTAAKIVLRAHFVRFWFPIRLLRRHCVPHSLQAAR